MNKKERRPLSSLIAHVLSFEDFEEWAKQAFADAGEVYPNREQPGISNTNPTPADLQWRREYQMKARRRFMTSMGATESEISKGEWDQWRWETFGQGGTAETILFAASPLGARRAARFDRGIKVSEKRIQRRIGRLPSSLPPKQTHIIEPLPPKQRGLKLEPYVPDLSGVPKDELAELSRDQSPKQNPNSPDTKPPATGGGSLKNRMGDPDQAALRARTDPVYGRPAPIKPAVPETGPTPNKTSPADRNYIFRGDDNFRGGTVGKPLGAEADAADIQSFADHVLRKESGTSSRFSSFTTETKVAKKFTSAPDFRSVTKAEMELLQALEAKGIIKIHTPDSVYEAMKAGPKKLSKEASAVRDAMRRNGEILIEGQIPEGVLQKLK